MVTGGPHYVVSFTKLHVCSHFYMYICSLIAYKMLLEKKAAQPKERTRGLISYLYNYTAIDRFGYANYSQSTQSVCTTRWAFVEGSLIFISCSLLVVSLLLLERYELVLFLMGKREMVALLSFCLPGVS